MEPEFDELGIKPLVHGIPDLPRASQTAALARRIRREGIRGHDGTEIVQFDDAGAAMLAYPWAYPAQVAAQLSAPQAVSVQAGTLYYVTGLALTTRVMPPYHNSRARSKLEIPAADASGHVSFPWPVRDVRPDPHDDHRLLITAHDLDALAAAAQATAERVEGMQSDLKEALRREGVEEQVLMAPARFELLHGALDDNLAWLTFDGGSRATIAQGFLADAVDAILGMGKNMAPKRRRGLEELGVHLRGRVAGLLARDPVAERDLRDELERLVHQPAAELVANGLYGAQRALVIPARALVAFRPHRGTVLDATQQLIGNAHKRGPKQWDTAATAVDTRDEVLRKLDNDGLISESELYLLGPAFEEAYTRLGITDNPDFRIGELVRFFHDQDPLSDTVRTVTREVLRLGRLMPAQRAKVISGAILEQVREADAKRRQNIESGLDELLAHPPFFNADVWWPSRDPDVSALLAEAGEELENGNQVWYGPAMTELAVKGGLALAILGPLWRIYGETDATLRLYNLLPRMVKDSFGQELLAEGIRALRAGKDHIAARDPETCELIYDAAGAPLPMDATNLRKLFPSAAKAVKKAQPTEADFLRAILSRLKDGVSSDLGALEELPAVRLRGISPSSDLLEALALFEDYRDRLKFLERKHRQYYAENPALPLDDDDEDEAVSGAAQ
ncbi:hypothetical protein GCM10009608_39190 [Pseudonocardia alaniniphila]